jgi:large subunit ribosomal protein L25
MAETVVLHTQPRPGKGTRQAQKLRQEGRVPAVVYGHKEATESVAITLEELQKAVKAGSPIVDLSIGGKTQKAQIRELQWDHLGKDILHADFKRVSEDERIVTSVKIELRGTPLGLTEGGVIDQPIHVLEVECPVIAVPHAIRVDISGLQLGQALHVKELTMPPNVKAMADGDTVVVLVKLPAVEAAAPAEVGVAEPEVITARKEEAEAEE